MALRIKSPEAYELAQQLAQRTGESLTLAVTHALKARLEQLNRADLQDARAQRILDIGRRCAAMMAHPTRDHATHLYDESGALK